MDFLSICTKVGYFFHFLIVLSAAEWLNYSVCRMIDDVYPILRSIQSIWNLVMCSLLLVTLVVLPALYIVYKETWRFYYKELILINLSIIGPIAFSLTLLGTFIQAIDYSSLCTDNCVRSKQSLSYMLELVHWTLLYLITTAFTIVMLLFLICENNNKTFTESLLPLEQVQGQSPDTCSICLQLMQDTMV